LGGSATAKKKSTTGTDEFASSALRCDIPVVLVKLQNIMQTLEVKTQLYYIFS